MQTYEQRLISKNADKIQHPSKPVDNRKGSDGIGSWCIADRYVITGTQNKELSIESKYNTNEYYSCS